MSYYPILLKFDGKTALIVGGGKVAERKVEALLQCGASIRIVSRELTSKLKALIELGRLQHHAEEFKEKYLDNAFLVVAATDDKQLNHRISESARKRGLLINAVDQPDDCNFFVPSIVRRGDLLIAISTSGKSPALAKKIRKELENQYGNAYKIFLNLMGILRKEILSQGLSQEENSRIFHEIVDSDILDALALNNLAKGKYILGQILPRDMNIADILQRSFNNEV